MSIVFLLDPKTQVGYPIEVLETATEALNRKERLRVDYPANLFYFTVNIEEPNVIYSLEEALLIVNGEDIYKDVQG